MGANANGVSARVTDVARPGSRLDRLTSWLTDIAVRPLALGAIAGLFLVAALGSAVWFERVTSRDQTIASAAGRLDLVASLTAHELRAAMLDERPTAEHLRVAISRLPAIAASQGRRLYLSDPGGFIVGAEADAERRRRQVSDIFDGTTPRPLLGTGGVFNTALSDGTPVIATMRSLASGELTVVQPLSDIMGDAQPISRILPSVAALSLCGLALLGFGCHLHARRAQQAGRTSVRLRSNLDTSLARGRCGLWDWDLARGRVAWSTSLYEILGYEPREDDLSVHEVSAILHPREGTLRQLVEQVAASASYHIDQDIRALTAAGEWRWLRIRADLVLDPHDHGRHVVGVAIDVTEDLGDAEARAGADRRLRDAVDALPEAFVLWDAEERLILCNSKYRQLHGFPPELARPGTPFSVLTAVSDHPMREPNLAGPPSPSPAARTTETRLSNGRWLQVSERRTRDGGVVLVETDVSDLKRNEARLRETERRLKASVRVAETRAQRFALIAERNYEANVAKNDFLARLSHELRTPLTAIMGFADMMRQELLGPLGCGRYVEYTRDIHASGERLLGVIEGILQMSTIEAGQVDFAPELMAVSDALDGAIGAIERDVRAKSLKVERDIDEPVLVHADGRALNEILVQILRNAAAYTREGGTVRVRVRPAGGRLNIFVADDGVGIHPDVLPRLGRPFEQVEAEYSRSSGGTGLGLAIARALVELHRGTLRIKSEPGVGTIVLIHMPLVQPPANDFQRIGAENPAHLRLVAGE